MTELKYLSGAAFMLKCSFLYPIDPATSIPRKALYFIWGLLYWSSLLLTFIQCAVYLYRTPFDLIGESMIIMNTVIYFSVFANFTFLFAKRKKLFDFVRNINEQFVNSSDNCIEEETMEKASGLSDKFAYYWGFSCVIITLMPCIAVLLAGNTALPIIEWIPYETDDPLAHFLTYIWQFFCLSNLGLIFGILDMVWPCIALLMGQQFKILASNFKNNVNRALLDSRIDESDVGKFMQTHDDIFQRLDVEAFGVKNFEYFSKNVRHHQRLLRLGEDVNDILGTFLMGKISAAIFNTLFMAFSMITTGNNAMLVGLGTYMMSTTTELFIYTYSGQILTQNADIADSLYECPWYYCDLKFQKSFHIVQIRAAKTVCLKAGNYFSMEAQSFITFMKALFSYVTLLRELTKREG